MARFQGRLIEWHDEQGYGFIQGLTDPRQQRVFLHIKSFQRAGPRPIAGCVLEYELALDEKSRPKAINVCSVKAQHVQQAIKSSPRKAKAATWHPMYIVMACYWVMLFVLTLFAQLPVFSLMIILLINSYTYWIYYQDKQAAMQRMQRISEQHLLLMSALGGWTAAWFAARHFRHKTQKQPFKTYFALSIVINFVLITFAVYIQKNVLN